MPLPEDDDHICWIEKNGKPEFATAIDHLKFIRLVGETILENLDKIDCSKCGKKMYECICNNDESCPDCGFRDCICIELDENVDDWDRDDN